MSLYDLMIMYEYGHDWGLMSCRDWRWENMFSFLDCCCVLWKRY